MKTWVFQGALLAGSLATGVLAIELGLRMFMPLPRSDYRPIMDPSHRRRLLPDASMVEVQPEFEIPIRINESGFRGEPFPEKKKGRRRFLALGDSFLFGTGVKASERASEKLAERLDADVINLGIPATQTWDHLELFEEKAREFSPDQVLLFFYLGNDVRDNAKVRTAPVEQKRRTKSGGWSLGKIRRAIQDESRLYAFLMRRTARFPALARFYNRFKTTGLHGETAGQLTLFERSSREAVFWDASEKALKAMASAAAERNLPLTVVWIPTRIQYDHRLWSELLEKQGFERKRFDLNLPQKVLGGRLAEIAGLRFIDSTPSFRKAFKAGRRLYYPINGHLDASGQTVLAEAVAEAILYPTKNHLKFQHIY